MDGRVRDILSTVLSMEVDLKRRVVHTEMCSSLFDEDEYVVTI